MNQAITVTIDQAANAQRAAIIRLLRSAKLPVSDLPDTLEHFFTATVDDVVAGAIGVEFYGSYALLRSMIVDESYRNHGIAAKLIQQLENYIASKGIKTVYLLTETAQDYFARKGFVVVNRADVPAVLQGSSEFKHTCPASAIAMKKEL